MFKFGIYKYINLNSNNNLNNNFLKGTPKNLRVCNENDNIELSKIKLTNNSDCRINRCYNNLYNYDINTISENNCFMAKSFFT